MKFSEFSEFVNKLNGDRCEHQRLGQWAFNLLCKSHPDEANQIRGGEFDPFHRDDKIPCFLSKLLENVKMDQ